MIFTVKSLGFVAMSTIIGSALMSGRRLRRHPQADFGIDVTSCEVTGHQPVPYQLDGDYLGDVEHLTLAHEPEALDVFMPCT